MDIIRSFQALPTDTFMRAVHGGFSYFEWNVSPINWTNTGYFEWNVSPINWTNTGYFVWKVYTLADLLFKTFPQHKSVITWASWSVAISGSVFLIALMQRVSVTQIENFGEKIRRGETLTEEDKKAQTYVLALKCQLHLIKSLKAIEIGLSVLDLYYQRNQTVAGLKLATVVAVYAADYIGGKKDFPLHFLLGHRLPAAVNKAVKAYLVYQDYQSGNFGQAFNKGDYKRVTDACAHAYSWLYLS